MLALDFDSCLMLLSLQLSLAPVWQGLYYISTMGGRLCGSSLSLLITWGNGDSLLVCSDKGLAPVLPFSGYHHTTVLTIAESNRGRNKAPEILFAGIGTVRPQFCSVMSGWSVMALAKHFRSCFASLAGLCRQSSFGCNPRFGPVAGNFLPANKLQV